MAITAFMVLASCGTQAPSMDTEEGPWSGGSGDLPASTAGSMTSGGHVGTGDESGTSGLHMGSDSHGSTSETSASESSGDTDGGGPQGPHGTCGAGGPGIGAVETVDFMGSYFGIAAPPPGSGPYPLVVILHGDDGQPAAPWNSGWGPLWAEEQSFIAMMPKAPTAPTNSWWQGDLEANAAWLIAAVASVADGHDVDIDRIYLIGYSGGSTFLGAFAPLYQDVFAAVQFTCGGAPATYTPPPAPECRIPGRFVMADDDFMVQLAEPLYESFVALGHEMTWVSLPCSGHCCQDEEHFRGAWEWMLEHTKCGGTSGSGCGSIFDIP